jgi:predicted metalloprotease
MGHYDGVILRRLLILVLAGTLAAACGGDARDPAGTSSRGSAAGPCDARGEDFAGDVELARCLTERFWARRFQASGNTYAPISDFDAYNGEDGPDCGRQPSVPNNAFYCPSGHFIAYDAAWLEGMYARMGDGAVYLVVPHEFGHAVQAQLVNDFRFNVQRELQADYYAGATLSGLIQEQALQADEGDGAELLANLEAAGDPTDAWWAPDAHGTATQRQASFAKGYGQGVRAC